MLDILKNVGAYIGIAFVVILAIIGIVYQVRIYLNKDKRETQAEKYLEFQATIKLLQDKARLQQEAIDQLTTKVRELEKINQEQHGQLQVYNERANHYLALFATRCPYEALHEGRGYCDLFHPIDKEQIRQNILSKIVEAEGHETDEQTR